MNGIDGMEMCACDGTWYPVREMAMAGHQCAMPERGNELGRRIVLSDVLSPGWVTHGPVPWGNQPTTKEDHPKATGAGDGDTAEVEIHDLAQDMRKGVEKKSFSGIVVRDFAVKGGKNAYAYAL